MTVLRWGNDSGVAFQGYLRATVDVSLAFPNGTGESGAFILGNDCGLDTKCIDVYTAASPNGDRRSMETNTQEPFTWQIGPAFGNVPCTVGGVAMTLLSEVANGAGWDAHWHARVGPMLHVDVFVKRYPDDLQYGYVEVVIDASNPAVTDVVGIAPANFTLVYDGATVVLAGLADNAPLMTEGDWLADGQPKVLSGVLCFPQHGGSTSMCRALAEGKINLVGLTKVHHLGNPILPAGFSATAWTATNLASVMAHLHSWPVFVGPPVNGWVGGISTLDPNRNSGDTGGQGSQRFVAGAPMQDCNAVGPIYLAGLTQKWPCCHLEADGSLLAAPPAHPNLRMNNGRVNRALGAGDVLGKPTEPSDGLRRGLLGPEWEHDFDWILWAAKRYRGSPALEWLVSQRARLTLFSSPRPFYSPPGNFLPPHRGIGWFVFKCVELYRNLTDRTLAAAIKTFCVDTIDTLIIPTHGNQQFPESWWHWTDSASIGASPEDLRAIPWQPAVMSLSLRWAGEVFGHAGALALSASMAQSIITRVWLFHAGSWHARDVIRMNGLEAIDPETGLPYMDDYGYFGNPMGPAAMLLADPTHEPSGDIWAQLLADATSYDVETSWMSPGVLPPVAPPIVGTMSGSVSTSVVSVNALSISAQVSGTLGLQLAAASKLKIQTVETGFEPITTTCVARGAEVPTSEATASMQVELEFEENEVGEKSAHGALAIAGTASMQVDASIVRFVGFNLLGLTGQVEDAAPLTCSASSTGKLRVAADSSRTVSTSVASAGIGSLVIPPNAGAVSKSIGISARSTASLARREQGSPGRPRKKWHWWDVAELFTGRRKRR